MSNHLGDTNKMVSETPISDSTPHNVADLGMLCRRLERELNAANQIGKKYEDRYFAALDRIKQLEDRIDRASSAFFNDGSDASVASGMLTILEEERNKQ